ncbi:acyltransferase family protein [Fluviispira sanaruensis]|uniref:acyltransferase family protein n=1 Tax=Fluviispira sanaruensis TaxID=2493639 RepID=UPI0015586919|nr:acyltransferase family protein [Fluviispira sanaruensis]
MNINKNLEYRPDIDGLRAIAVLSVVLFHFFPVLNPGGFIGVDIFFVISGFLISTIIYKNLDNQSFKISEFYTRRIIRIFPALIFVLCTVLILGWLLLFEREFKYLGKHIAGGIGFISNELQWRENVDYFNSGFKPLQNLWSLGVEEQFYLLWPFLAILCWKYNKNFLKIIVSMFFISFLINIFSLYIFEKMSEAYLMTFSRLWEIIAGCFLGYITLYKEIKSNPILNNLKSISGFFLITLSLCFIDSTRFFPGFWALLPVAATYLIIDSGPKAFLNQKILANKLLVYIGLISYPIYLWHWPLLIYNKLLAKDNPSNASLVIIFIMTIILSIITYHLLEKSIKRINKKTAIYSLVPIAISLLIIGISGYKRLLKPYSSQFNLETFNAAVEDWDFPTKNLYKLKYNNSYYYESSNDKDKILFMGDSNMEQYAPRIEKILYDHPNLKKNTILFTGSGCMPIKNVKILGKTGCQEYLQDVYNFAEDPQIPTVVISGLWLGYLSKDSKAYYEKNDFKEYLNKSELAKDKMLKEFEDSIKRLVELKKSVYVVLNIPIGNEFSPTHMISRSLFNNNFSPIIKDMNKNEFLDSENGFLKKLKQAALKGGAQVIDPLDYLCNENSVCLTLFQNKPFYKDSGHLCASFVRENIKYLDFIFIKKSEILQQTF